MKNLLILILLFTLPMNAQTVTYKDISAAGKEIQKFSMKVGLYKEYIASSGESFRVGKSVVLGVPSRYNDTYQHVYLTDNFSYEAYASSDEGFASEITRIKIQKNRNGGYGVFLIGYSGLGGKYWIDIEAAIGKGEIESKVMTKFKAIVKLREAKELLDLEVITKEEYDKLNEELKPIIRANNN